LKLVTPDNRTIDLAGGCVRVGRNDLGGSPKVSALHAVFRRVGPETTVESVGRNGVYRKVGERWVRLSDGKAILIRQGNVLRLADQEVRVV
jgi:pSer/pThr/pTyr-binding forkhead associated (FHA) protein